MGCLIADCDRPKYKRGWCSRHYQKWLKYGDPLGTGKVHGKGLRFIAEVALFHEGDECLLWPYGGGKGYGSVNLDGRKQIASRIVCDATHGVPPTDRHEATHSCGNGHLGCVSPQHIRWGTHAENMADTVGHGTSGRGQTHGMAKLTDDAARQVKRLALAGKAHRHIASTFGISKTQVSNIASGRAWKWLQEERA